MTREQAKALLESPTLKAFSDGKIIQHHVFLHQWADCYDALDLDNVLNHPERYRIKPEPREFWAEVQRRDSDVKGWLYESLEHAEKYGINNNPIIKVREVL